MVTCAKCGHQNADGVQFCTACHNTLYFSCPHCWHRQRQLGKCEKCGMDIALALNVQAASAMAAAIKEESGNVQASGQQVANNLQLAEMAFFSPVNFLTTIGLRYAWEWLSNRFSGK